MVALTSGQRTALDALRRRHGIRLILAHGSRVSGRARPDSDLDLAMLPASGSLGWGVWAELEDAFPGMETDVADLSRADPFFLGQIQACCQLLSGDPTEYQEFRIHAFRRYQEYRPFLAMEARMNRRRLETA